MIVHHVHNQFEANLVQPHHHFTELADALHPLRIRGIAPLRHIKMKRIVSPVEPVPPSQTFHSIGGTVDLLNALGGRIRGGPLLKHIPNRGIPVALALRLKLVRNPLHAQAIERLPKIEPLRLGLVDKRHIIHRKQVQVRHSRFRKTF